MTLRVVLRFSCSILLFILPPRTLVCRLIVALHQSRKLAGLKRFATTYLRSIGAEQASVDRGVYLFQAAAVPALDDSVPEVNKRNKEPGRKIPTHNEERCLGDAVGDQVSEM